MEKRQLKLKGYSKGVAFSLLKRKGNYGLVELPEWIYPVWCKFEIIRYE